MCALALGLANGSIPALAQAGVVTGATGLQEVVGTSFTYQGRVLHEDTAINGSCDFEFSLWDDPGGGTDLGVQPIPGVPVSDGYFTVELDFGAGAFTGGARYLQIGVDCGQGFALLEPRQALTAAPYAHGLRPGAAVESATGAALNLTTSATSGAALNAIASASSGNAAAVYGSSQAADGAGVSGYNTRSGYGVYGSAAGGTGVPYGVYGLAGHAGSATSYGVFGKSNSSVGTGVGGEAPMNGIYGKATASNGYGVYGEATASSGSTYGVYGKATSSSGKGVYGEGHTGVHGSSSAGAGVWGSSADGWGVSGSSNSSYGVRGGSNTGTGVYGEGPTGVHGSGSTGAGVWGSSADGYGVSGSSTNSYGIRGGSTHSTGVYGTAPVTGTAGIATNSGGLAWGVYGKTTSPAGRGVHGEGGYYGVYAVGTDPTGISYGVYGRTLSSSTGASGVYGHAAAAAGTTYGVYGRSDSAAGYGVYSAGDAHVEGDLAVSGNLTVSGNIVPKTRTATLSVAPAAFWPWKHDKEYTNEGYYLKPAGGAISDLHPFFAPLQLPHNARITKVTGCFMSERPLTNGDNVRFGLERADFAGGSAVMAFAANPDGDGQYEVTCLYDDTIQDPVIDNRNMAYYLWVSLIRDAEFYGMKVEYEYASP
jgi:hypothetical protein